MPGKYIEIKMIYSPGSWSSDVLYIGHLLIIIILISLILKMPVTLK